MWTVIGKIVYDKDFWAQIGHSNWSIYTPQNQLESSMPYLIARQK